MKTSHLTVSHLSAKTKEGKEILHDVSLSFSSSKVYAVMGPNGSGKSTLAHALMGNSEYNIQGNIIFNRKHIEKILTEERARLGLFLSYQSPVAIPGVSVMQLLRTAYHSEKCMALTQLYAKVLHIDQALLTRSIHDGFSGGERKKIEENQKWQAFHLIAWADKGNLKFRTIDGVVLANGAIVSLT